ncbi:hypothetical protein K443DRAFT_4289 [Laccaria amethystina LaAM-08-1]|uniref:methionine--tRNA ligase n=1 Tax=Laccaria amethystina LaAM-08-1 TaxID=1095629 RepID=A0A0C9XIT5_9AGAR|nr:hypothetical protein K443DRAFT_4289 [Laccaria amethystina LaAM-08-1]
MLLLRRVSRVCTLDLQRPLFFQLRLLSTLADAKKPYYVTTPIFYPNAVPHIGHLYTLVLGDIFARYQRILDPTRPVHFLAGTDEHGLKIQQAAEKAGVEPKAFCDSLSGKFRDLADRARIGYTVYMRTTQEQHKKAVEHVWLTLDQKGFIYKGQYEGWYSITDECFYTDAQVMPAALPSSSSFGGENPAMISIETSSPVEWTTEQNYMFRLSAFRKALEEHYRAQKTEVHPPPYHSAVLQMLDSASSLASSSPDAPEPILQDISISRPRSRLSWGIPVPTDPLNHTIYVWFDALLVYLSGVGYPWLPASTSSEYSVELGPSIPWPADLQIIGKDILRFHALYLPAILMALSSPSPPSSSFPSPPQQKLPLSSKILTHAHWTVSRQKMSKSLGNVADPLAAMSTYGVDIVRYYLATVGGRFRDDVDWSPEQLTKHSKELQSLLGNYFLRVSSKSISAAAQRASSPLPTLISIASSETVAPASNAPETIEDPNPNRTLLLSARALPTQVQKALDNLEVGEALDEIIALLRLANKTVTTIAPWSASCPPTDVYATQLVALETLRITGICLQPFIPDVAEKLLDGLGVPAGERDWASAQSEVDWKGRVVKGVRLF